MIFGPFSDLLSNATQVATLPHPHTQHVTGCKISECELAKVPVDVRDMVEADCYWCLSKLLDGIQVSLLCV